MWQNQDDRSRGAEGPGLTSSLPVHLSSPWRGKRESSPQSPGMEQMTGTGGKAIFRVKGAGNAC